MVTFLLLVYRRINLFSLSVAATAAEVLHWKPCFKKQITRDFPCGTMPISKHFHWPFWPLNCIENRCKSSHPEKCSNYCAKAFLELCSVRGIAIKTDLVQLGLLIFAHMWMECPY